MISKIMQVPIRDIDPNPFRLLGKYPYNEKKLEALERSINDVGLWEGIIGRENGNRVEIAFGHHRHKAAFNAGLDKIPVIIRNLTDEQMLQFMGRENLEDYNADFLAMLETWEAALLFLKSKETQTIEIARLLGWTRRHHTGNDTINNTASACNAAYALINAGHLNREDLTNLAVSNVLQLVERTYARVKQIDEWAKEKKVDHKVVEQQKQHLAGAAKSVAKQVREGTIATKDVRERVDLEAFSRQIKANKGIPNFSVYGEALGDMIQKMLANDAAADRLQQIQEVVHEMTDPNDQRIVKRISFELDHLINRANEHKRKLDTTVTKAAVTPLRVLPDKGA